MFNAICFADLHIDNYSKHSVNRSRLNNCLSVLDLVFKTARERGVDLIVFCGDLFDKPTNISVVAFNATVLKFKELFEIYPEITFVAIAGNHDYTTAPELDKPAETSLDIFPALFSKFILLDHTKPRLYYNYSSKNGCVLHGVEFFYHPEEYYQAITNRVIDHDFTNILITHATLTGVITSVNGNIDPSFEGYTKFHYVLSGDIHQRKDFGKVLMLGSPLHKDLSDLSDSKGIWHIQVDRSNVLKREFITTDHLFPLFQRVEEGSDISSIPQKDFIVYVPKQLQAITLDNQTEKIIEALDSYESSDKDKEMLKSYLEYSGLNDIGNLVEVGANYLARV